MAKYTSLVDIWTSRPDLQKAFPQGLTTGTTDNEKLNNWWNQYGIKEYPGVTLVQPGDSRIQNPTTLTAEAQQGTTPDVEIGIDAPTDEVGGKYTNYDYWKIYQDFGLDISQEELEHHIQNQTDPESLRNWLVANQGTLVEARAAQTPTQEIEAPPSLTQAEIDLFRAAAEEEWSPYYEEQINLARREAGINIGELETEARITTERSARNLSQAIDESSAAMAARGLAFSGIRQKEAGNITTEYNEELEDALRSIESQRQGTLRTLEEAIGTQAIQKIYPNYYSDLDLLGNIEREKLTGIESAAQALIAEEKEKRNQSYYQQVLYGYGV